MDKQPFVRLIKCVMVMIFSTDYASTLFYYANKPDSVVLLYQNNFPALITLLIIITYLYLMSEKKLTNDDNPSPTFTV